MPKGTSLALEINALRARAKHTRLLAKEMTDTLTKIGLIQLAEEYERQAAQLETTP